MKDFNEVRVIGRLTKDAELKFLQSGSAKSDFAIAFTTSKKNGNDWVDESNFLNLTLWGKRAESLDPYLKKGTQVLVIGSLKQDRYEKDGQKMSVMKVIVEDIKLLGNGGKSSNGSSNQESEIEEDIPFGDESEGGVPF